ncbi:MAG: hypothetical protein ACI8ZM_001795 [Crocinitomix sp.]|jgi:hypothetical protein
MNTLKTINTRNLFLTLMVLAGFTTSCEKEVISEVNNGRAIVTNVDTNRGGDDEEEPILYGIVEDGNGIKLQGAEVKIYPVGSSIPMDSQTTDSNGEFEMTIPAGNYYFKVTVSSVTTTTNNVSILADTNITIIV